MTLGPKALALLFDHTELRPPKVKVMVKWSAIHISGSFYVITTFLDFWCPDCSISL